MLLHLRLAVRGHHEFGFNAGLSQRCASSMQKKPMDTDSLIYTALHHAYAMPNSITIATTTAFGLAHLRPCAKSTMHG
jgi:hypothetical protein